MSTSLLYTRSIGKTMSFQTEPNQKDYDTAYRVNQGRATSDEYVLPAIWPFFDSGITLP